MDIAELGLSVRSDGVVVATDRLRRFDGQAARTQRSSAALTGVFSRLATVAGAALAAAFSVREMIAFRDGLAEVSTLVDTTTFSMKTLTNSALDQASQFGNLQGQVKAYYQIISAGAGSVAEATDILTASNKLAVGGVTDIATAADGLTSVLNAYGDKVEGATDVSDALFTAMRAGKTTIGELSGSLGKVAPLAAQTGVSFDELAASVAALTKGGISTREAVTGVRAILAAVAKPTSEAAKMAAALGLEFNSAALESKGLVGFLEDLVAKTGGSTDALSMLFGGVEALIPVMALAGQAGQDFTIIMGQMAEKAGQTEMAFNKMAASPGFQMQRLMSGLTAEALKMSGTLGDQLVPVLTVLADNVDLLPVAITALAAAITTVMIPAIVSATASFGALTLAMATNPFVQLAVVVAALAGGLVYLNQQQGLAAEAAATHQAAIVTNSNAIETAKTATQGYRDELQKQINMQISAAEAALQEARAQVDAARMKASAADLFGDLVSGAARWLGLPGEDRQYGAQILEAQNQKVAEAQQRLSELRMQLFRFADQMSMVPAAAEPVVHKVDEITTSLGNGFKSANDNAIDLTKGIRSTTGALSEMEQFSRSVTSTLATGFSDVFKAVVTGSGNAMDAVGRLVSRLGDMFLNQAFQMLFGGFNPLGFVFGGGMNFSPGVGPLATGLFASGGYTGNAPTNMPTGIVHGQEFVMSAAATRRIGRPALEAMNDGGTPANQNGGGINLTMHNTIQVPPGATEAEGAAFARAFAKELKVQLPDALQKVERNPLRRHG